MRNRAQCEKAAQVQLYKYTSMCEFVYLCTYLIESKNKLTKTFNSYLYCNIIYLQLFQGHCSLF